MGACVQFPEKTTHERPHEYALILMFSFFLSAFKKSPKCIQLKASGDNLKGVEEKGKLCGISPNVYFDSVHVNNLYIE